MVYEAFRDCWPSYSCYCLISLFKGNWNETIQVFWDSHVDWKSHWRLEIAYSLNCRGLSIPKRVEFCDCWAVEGGDSKHLRNIGNDLPIGTMSYTGRFQFLSIALKWLQISNWNMLVKILPPNNVHSQQSIPYRIRTRMEKFFTCQYNTILIFIVF